MNPQLSSVTALPPPYTAALLAALSNEQEAAEAFNRWQALVDVDELPAGQFPLLPSFATIWNSGTATTPGCPG
jgi:hypothetical protein